MFPEDALLDKLDRMDCGGVLLDAAGRVLRSNPSAECHLARHCGAEDQGGDRGHGWLEQAVGLLLQSAVRFRGMKAASVVTSGSGAGLIAYKTAISAAEDEGCTLLVLIDVEECLRPSEELLQVAFGLTETEARLASRLACGESLQDVVDVLGVSLATGRVHLNAVLAKTGTSRQAELVAVLGRLALASRLERVLGAALALGQAPSPEMNGT